jgi:hypothetical protein
LTGKKRKGEIESNRRKKRKEKKGREDGLIGKNGKEIKINRTKDERKRRWKKDKKE